jgi:hypothetical protein
MYCYCRRCSPPKLLNKRTVRLHLKNDIHHLESGDNYSELYIAKIQDGIDKTLKSLSGMCFTDKIFLIKCKLIKIIADSDIGTRRSRSSLGTKISGMCFTDKILLIKCKLIKIIADSDIGTLRSRSDLDTRISGMHFTDKILLIN